MSLVPIKTTDKSAVESKLLKRDQCDICHMPFKGPYIACAECKYKQKHVSDPKRRYQLCLNCFASGAESENHSNNHAYIIVHDNVKVFLNSTWSGREDSSLLEQMMRQGFSNWADIGRRLNSHSAEECRDHYIDNYFGGIFWKVCQLTKTPYNKDVVPYLYRLHSVDPPRKLDMIQSKLMAEYRFARSDFDTPFDSSAENVISNLDVDWGNEFQTIGNDLNCAMMRAYNNRLRERNRRRKILREHGLILPNRAKSWFAKYNKAMSLKNSSDSHSPSGRFIAFMQLSTGVGFDRIVEGLQYEYDLRKFLHKLYELRASGIKTCHGGRIFQNAKLSRTCVKPSHSWEWKHLTVNKRDIVPGTEQILNHCMDLNSLPKKRRSTPLNIIGLSNYEKLNKDEQELCSTIRIIPDSYLIYKKLLTSENTKMGYLRLADARRLVKIDVNKTRVMYDFLYEHGFINKPSQ